MPRPKTRIGKLSMGSRGGRSQRAPEPSRAPGPPPWITDPEVMIGPWKVHREKPQEPPGDGLRKWRERVGPIDIQVFVLKVTPDREQLKSMTKLKAARKKVQDLGTVVRDEAFDDWLGRYVVNAERPDEWTRSRVLYDNYLKRAKDYGQNRADKALSKQALATETMWGKMMGTQFPNKRRTRDGWFYPVRLKQGA